MNDGPKQALDGMAALGAAGALFNALPKIAAGLACFWYLYRFWEVWGRAAFARLRARLTS